MADKPHASNTSPPKNWKDNKCIFLKGQKIQQQRWEQTQHSTDTWRMESRHVTGDFDHKRHSERVQPTGLSYISPLLSPGSSRWREGWETGWNRGWRSDTKRMDLGSASPLLLSAPSASQEAYYPNKLNQGDWRWQKACEKVMWFRAENSERDSGNKGESTDHPMGSTSPSLRPASRCFQNTQSLSQPRLIPEKAGGIFLWRTWMNTHTNMWED